MSVTHVGCLFLGKFQFGKLDFCKGYCCIYWLGFRIEKNRYATNIEHIATFITPYIEDRTDVLKEVS